MSPQDGPGSWKGLSSLRCSQLGAALRAAFLRVHCRDGGFLNPLVVGCVWPVSNSQGSAGRKPVSASQHEAKHGFHHTQTWGLRGPFLNEPAIALALKVANGERLCLLWRAWGTAHSDRAHREGPVISVLTRGCGSQRLPGLRPAPKPPSKTLSTFMGAGKLRLASVMPRLAQVETISGQTTPSIHASCTSPERPGRRERRTSG